MANPNNPDQPKSGATTNRPDQPKGTKSAGSSGGKEGYTFRCADAGFSDCPWQTRGSSPDEVLHSAEQHGRERHQMATMDEQTRNRVRSNIRRAA